MFVGCVLVCLICQAACDHRRPCNSFLTNSFSSCKDRALERDRPYQRKKKSHSVFRFSVCLLVCLLVLACCVVCCFCGFFPCLSGNGDDAHGLCIGPCQLYFCGYRSITCIGDLINLIPLVLCTLHLNVVSGPGESHEAQDGKKKVLVWLKEVKEVVGL